MSASVRVGLVIGAYFTSIAVTSFMPLWYADRGLSPEAIGQILGAATFLRILAGPGWGNVTDRIGRRRPVLLVAGALATGMALLFPTTYGFLPLLIVAGGQGIAASALNPLIDSLALALARERRLEYGPVRAVGSATFMITTASMGSLLNAVGSWVVPWLMAAGYGMATLFSRFLPEAQSAPAAPRAFAGLALFRNPGFRLTLLSSGLIQGAHAAYYGFAALFWRSQGFSDTVIGLLLAEGIIVEILLFTRGRRVIERLGPAGLTGCAAAASILRWGVTAISPPLAVLSVIQLLHAATFAMQHLSAMTVLSRHVPAERAATAQALHNALGFGAPSGLTMLAAGWLYANHGGAAFAAMAVVGGAALFLVVPLARLRPDPYER
ncbi:MAG: MFS transporter [Acetobacteraceae bacterium]